MKSILVLLLLAQVVLASPVIVIYKLEMTLEIHDGKSVIATYQICSLANRYLPKEKAGDMRTPEGVYKISFINRHSASYKTIGISYPNALDKSLGRTGGGVGIHGKCCSSGCIGMSNDQMDSIIRMLDSRHVKSCPIIILPTKDGLELAKLKKQFPEYAEHWKNMKGLLAKVQQGDI